MSHDPHPDRPLAFGERVARLSRKQRLLAKRGLQYSLDPNGLITVVPRRRRGPRLGSLGLILATALLLKAGLLGAVGETAYRERLAGLGTETWLARTAIWLMEPDPLTTALATGMTAALALR